MQKVADMNENKRVVSFFFLSFFLCFRGIPLYFIIVGDGCCSGPLRFILILLKKILTQKDYDIKKSILYNFYGGQTN